MHAKLQWPHEQKSAKQHLASKNRLEIGGFELQGALQKRPGSIQVTGGNSQHRPAVQCGRDDGNTSVLLCMELHKTHPQNQPPRSIGSACPNSRFHQVPQEMPIGAHSRAASMSRLSYQELEV